MLASSSYNLVMSLLSLHDIGLRPAQLKAVEKKAKHAGTTAPQYVRLLVERDLLADRSFDEMLRPIREDFRRSGISEKQLEKIVERARHSSPRRGAKARSNGTSKAGH
jgi:hypothetical protein